MPSFFDIDRATGQIMTKDKDALDAEGSGGSGTMTDSDGPNAYVEYTVVVRATDPSEVPVNTGDTDGSDTVTVTIRVTDVNDAPVVTAGSRACR